MIHQIRRHRILLTIGALVIFTFGKAASSTRIVSNESSFFQNGKYNVSESRAKEKYPKVSLRMKGLTAILDNGLIRVVFERDATVSSIYKNGKNLVENVDLHKTFYLDWHNGSSYHFAPTNLRVMSKSSERVHVRYLQERPDFLRLEYHIIMQRGLSGLYTYVYTSNTGLKPITFSYIRVVYRFDPKVMLQATNGVQESIIPDENELTNARLVQDATWRLSDGTYYSKYDYAAYIRETPYQGVFGNGYGSWLLSASREYHSGGPLRQDLTVHEAALILNIMTAGHFGAPELTATIGWSKIYGPWLMYFNEGSDDELKEDTIRQVKVEQSLWPYNWMDDIDYPLKRATLIGQVFSPVRSMVVLSSSLAEEFDLQVLGYSYSTETDENGHFKQKNIRPGTYKLIAYPVEGYGIGFQSEKEITIGEGKNTASLNLSVPTDVKWSIGETNRRSDSYRYSNETRNYIWHILPPADLEFEIGKNDIHTDWYYAQTKRGTWTIRYKDTPNGKNRILRIGIAAASNSVPSLPDDPKIPIIAVRFNEKLINKFHYKNDQSIYRSALQNGNFHSETIIIPANFVTEGDNLISLTLLQGYVMYDSINLSDEQ